MYSRYISNWESMKINQGRSIEIQDKKASSPFFFPSISSCGLKIDVKTLVETIDAIDYDTVLVSGYDIHHHNKDNKFDFIKDRLEKLSFVDCGCYESYWFDDSDWNFDKYDKTLKNTQIDFYTSFDVYMNEAADYDQYKKEPFESIIRSEKTTPKSILFPVLHNTRARMFFTGNCEFNPYRIITLLLWCSIDDCDFECRTRRSNRMYFDWLSINKNVGKKIR
jgi:hypothetical protein